MVFKQLNLKAMINNPISEVLIHSMGALFLDNTNMYTWCKHILDPGELWVQTQIRIEWWSCLLNATGGALKPEKCWSNFLDYTCVDGEWIYADIVVRELLITNLDGTKSPIKQEEVRVSKKTLGIYDAPAGGNKGHLDHMKSKATTWINRMTNGHLPSHVAWVAYSHQLWLGLQYGLGIMTNNIDPAASSLTTYTTKHSMSSAFCAMSQKDSGKSTQHLVVLECLIYQRNSSLVGSTCSSNTIMFQQT